MLNTQFFLDDQQCFLEYAADTANDDLVEWRSRTEAPAHHVEETVEAAGGHRPQRGQPVLLDQHRRVHQGLGQKM